ncbi:anti-sigma factor family protein [Methylocella tundrae]|uniref:Putative transmembrane anti-sigma factor n=1 Tax=Methylocella tundrae TaxID=227605 RepID=A0A4U8YXU6_METTU|nr:hypothetical protein [Methylocella tundrae]WPP05797.1 hypothetical protein SIN04_08295 [Methylocella tundrae]VFU08304.1 putative transmembrane anti-sigma factor [Methylocella tundrae]
MSGSLPPISDEDLHGFVDGEIPPERRRAVEAFLASSPADVERVDSWRRQGDIMRAAFARVEAESPPPSLLLPSPARKRTLFCLLRASADHPANGSQSASDSSGWRAAAAAIQSGLFKRRSTLAAFAAGAITAFAGIFIADRLHGPPFSDNIHAPAADKGLAERTLSALSAFKPSRIANSSSAAAGKPALAPNQNTLVIPNLSAAGLTLVGVRAAPGLAGPEADSMLCLFYAKAAEPPFALCVARDGNGGAPGFHISGQFPGNGGASVISWRQADAVYSLAGAVPEAKLRELANRVSAEVAAFDAR